MRRKLDGAASLFAIVAGMAAAGSPASAQGVPADQGTMVEEVIVTAQRRETALQDTPAAITVLTGQRLEAMGATGFADYARTVPGLFFTETGPSRRKYVLRGVQAEIGAGDSASTVAQYLDEVPITAFGLNEPDPLLFDVARVEVLRGPQGTLYGASSMGGTIRTITNKPDLSVRSARIAATLSSTAEGGFGGGADAMVNLPIVDGVLGLRAVLSYEDVAGFVDSPRLGLEDVNSSERISGRVMLRFRPNEVLDVTALYMIQDSEMAGSWRTDRALGQLVQNTSILEPYRDDFDVYNLTANIDVGFGTVTASTSKFDRNDTTPRIDQEFALAFGFIGPVGPGAFAANDRVSDGVAHEIRFASDFDGPFNFIAGAFYNKSYASSLENLFDVNGLTQAMFPTAPAGSTIPVFEEVVEREFEDTSFFGEGTLRLGDVELTVGARHYDISYLFVDTITVSPTFLGAPAVPPPTILNADATGMNWKFRAVWRANDRLMLYADASEGFRRGGTNIAHSFRPFVPESYDPDSLWSYELGFKSEWLGDRLVLNGALYQTDWSDAQIKSLLSGPNGLGGTAFAFGVVNAGDARIRGLELEAMFRPTPSLDIGASLSLMDSELVSNSPGADTLRGLQGDRLPGNAETQASLFVQHQQPIMSGIDLVVRADVSYLGDRSTELRPYRLDANGVPDPSQPNPNYFVMEGYGLANLRGSFVGDDWEATLFVHNLFDQRADQLLYTPFGQLGAGPQRTPIRPRTIGLTVRRSF